VDILKLLILGLISGIFSGILGIGGGLLMIPAMVFLLDYSQKLAQGTSLAILVLPIGILGAWRYYQDGNVDFHVVLWIALGFLVGAYLGADMVQGMSQILLRRIFGSVMLLVSLKMLWGK
jgi:uncharacterized protein